MNGTSRITKLQKLLLLIIVVGGACIILLKIFVQQFTSLKQELLVGKGRAVNIITVTFGGQLGNNIWEYMSLLAFMRLYENELNFVAYVPLMLKAKVEYVFERIHIQEISNIPKSFLKEKPYVLGVHESFQRNKLLSKTKRTLILAKSSARYDEIIQYGLIKLKKNLAFLRFRKKYIEGAYKVFDQIKTRFDMSQKNVTFIGMHYRGTDYIPLLKRDYKSFNDPPNSTFYIKAMNYFKNKYETLVFILITIDFQWLKENLPFIQENNNLVVNPNGNDFAKDLRLLSYCNHSIINYGTFGTTGALFAGGSTFAYNLKVPLDHKGATVAMGISKILSNWHLDE